MSHDVIGVINQPRPHDHPSEGRGAATRIDGEGGDAFNDTYGYDREEVFFSEEKINRVGAISHHCRKGCNGVFQWRRDGFA